MRFGMVLGWAIMTSTVSLGVSFPLAAETLREALIKAYLSNPELNASRAVLRANDELVNQVASGNLPDIFLRGGLSSRVGQSSVNDLDQTTGTAALTLNQNLYAGGNTQALIQQSEAIVQASRAQLLAAEQQIFFNVVSSYTSVWRDRSVLKLAINNEQRLARQLEATKVRNQVGNAAYTDVAQAEARLASAQADIENARADLASSAADYESIVGDAAGELARPGVLTTLPKNFAEAQAIADRNPNIIAQNYVMDAQRHAIDAAHAGLLPRLDLNGSLNLEGRTSGGEDRFHSAQIGLDLAIPLYQGGEIRAKVRQNRQILDQERHNLEAVQRRINRDVSSSWERLMAAGSARKSFEAEIRANEIALEGVEAEANEGVRTVLDVLDAQQELFESQIDLVRAQQSEIVASYQLKSSVGMLTVSGLELEVEPYDPEAYYQQHRTRLFGLDTMIAE